MEDSPGLMPVVRAGLITAVQLYQLVIDPEQEKGRDPLADKKSLVIPFSGFKQHGAEYGRSSRPQKCV